MNKVLAAIGTLCMTVNILIAQAPDAGYPVIGKPMPQFSLSNVHYYKTKTFNNNDLAGKWTIMDFWTKYCASCVAYFPKVNRLQEEFKDNIRFLLIGSSDSTRNKNTEAIYEKYRQTKNLELAVAYDSAIFEQFGIHGVPHIVVIDPQADVYAVTYGSFLTSSNLHSLIAGENPGFRKKYSQHETVPTTARLRPWKYLVNSKQRPDNLLYRSVLTKNSGEPDAGYYDIVHTVSQGMYQHVKFSLSQLYNVAYLGITGWNRWMPMYNEYWPYPIVEVADPSPFHVDYQQHIGLYNYSIVVPTEKSSKEYLMAMMQHDLRNCFGYDVSLETRLMPYWRLTATDEAKRKLISKSGVTEDYRDPSGITAKHITIGLVLAQIEEYNMDGATSLPFIDETNIKQLIDIEYHAALTDLDEVAKELKKIGLILEKRKKEMKVLVIRDPKPQTE